LQLNILNILEKVLGQSADIIKDDAAFWCPVCKNEKHKKKLVVNLNPNHERYGWWRCWICKDENKMGGKNLVSLLYRLKASKDDINNLSKQLDTGTLLVKKDLSKDLFSDEVEDKTITVNLPSHFHPLYEYKSSSEYHDALKYIANRGLSFSDIIKYNIGYCESGEYAHRLIIPSYDDIGKLNYFVSRTYYDSIKLKYKNPKINKDDIIIFDLFVNWKMPILICEGVFDAISAKRNSIPLLGNSLSSALNKKIIKENVKEVILALDMDIINTSLKYIEKFISNGISVKFINMDKKDPSELGFKKFIELYNNATPMHFEDLIRLKMKI